MTDTAKKTEQEARYNMAGKFPNLDFSEFKYINQNTEGTLICPDHGSRSRTYKDIMRSKHGCDLCSGTGVKARKSTESALQDLKELYGEEVFTKYDFSKVDYINARTPIEIICPDHGSNFNSLNQLLTRKAKTPCKQCNIRDRIAGQWDNQEVFLAKAMARHPGMDSYDKVVYQSSKADIVLTCLLDETHGEYLKRPNDYLQGQRCPKCSRGQVSSAEKELLEFICSLNLNITVAENLLFRNGMKPDIVIPEFNLAIEYHGLYWHSENRRGQRDCIDRLEYFKSIGIDLIQVFEDEWLRQPDIVKRRIMNRLGISERIYARLTSVRRISTTESKEFLDSNHLQGGTHNASHAYGLFYKEELISVATFSRPRVDRDRQEGWFEIIRFASKVNVVGGFSKLLRAFIRENSPSRIISYADLRWGEGTVYGKAGFTKTGNTGPGYFWCKAQTRYSRWNFQRHKLRASEEFKQVYSDSKKEEEMCTQLGYFKVYDCGHARWEMSL